MRSDPLNFNHKPGGRPKDIRTERVKVRFRDGRCERRMVRKKVAYYKAGVAHEKHYVTRGGREVPVKRVEPFCVNSSEVPVRWKEVG